MDSKADLDKVMPELVKKYGKNSPTKKEEFEEDELDEEIEQINELSPALLGRYIKKATYSAMTSGFRHGRDNPRGVIPQQDANIKKALKRQKGIAKAVDQLLSKEEFEEDELDEAKKSPFEKLQRFVGMNMFSPMVNKADWTDSYMEVNKSGKIVGILDNSELDGKHGYVAVYWNPIKKKVMLGDEEEHSDAWARRGEVKENFQDVNEAKQSGSFAAFFKTKGDSTFATNELRFRTEAEAKEYGLSLFNKWHGASEWKVMPHTDKPNTEIVNHVMKDIKESSHNSEEFEEMVMESDPTELELREFLTQLTSEEVTILRNIINETR